MPPLLVLDVLTCSPKCKCHFDENFVTGCTGTCHFDNLRCSQWSQYLHNGVISVSLHAENRWHLCSPRVRVHCLGKLKFSHEVYTGACYRWAYTHACAYTYGQASCGRWNKYHIYRCAPHFKFHREQKYPFFFQSCEALYLISRHH